MEQHLAPLIEMDGASRVGLWRAFVALVGGTSANNTNKRSTSFEKEKEEEGGIRQPPADCGPPPTGIIL